MENLLLNFANTNTQVRSENAKLSVSPEFYGTVDIIKGHLSMTINFYARMYKTKYDGYVSLDDWDINDTTNINFNGVPIDNIIALKRSMSDSGLSTLALSLEIDQKDIAIQISKNIQDSDVFKSIFGKKAIMLDSLSDEDRKKMYLKFAIDNYEYESLIKSEIGMFSVVDDNGENVLPSKEKLIEMYNNLN